MNAPETVEASCVVILLPNDTPVAIAADVGNNIGLRTASSPDFGETLRLLNTELSAPTVETVVFDDGVKTRLDREGGQI
jgi:hypothetical protein